MQAPGLGLELAAGRDRWGGDAGNISTDVDRRKPHAIIAAPKAYPPEGIRAPCVSACLATGKDYSIGAGILSGTAQTNASVGIYSVERFCPSRSAPRCLDCNRRDFRSLQYRWS